MLNMSNKFNNYQRTSATNIMGMNTNNNTTTPSAVAAASSSTSPSTSAGFTLSAPNNFSNDSNSSLTSNSGKAERESIHSGQFMVSTFEAEEAQDDLDDSEIKMLDPEDPSLSKADDEPNTCMEVQLYVPRNMAQQNRYGNTESHGLITSHLEIETSLTKLFKCMNLAYSQKLTSPKWNHFKGVRLRWKDKIRLNNVIWRCWHMQFILKRRTPVCQFASPLDVDIHSNPQSVVLEGKYWKRQLAVIKAEYRKWRRNYKSKVTGCLIYDTKSEFDFLEWSPLNDRCLMLSDDWTSDTLFSAINGPFPFPDSREIARGAGIADFIQPSLGPLQPNLDDIDLTFVELLQNSRLPPVPEEGSDEMIKNVDYGFSSIMGAEQIDSNNMMDVSSSNVVQSMPNTNDDTNMLELNTPLNTLQYSDIEQQFAARGGGANNNVQMLPPVNRTNETANQMQSLASDDAIMSDAQTATNSILMQQVNRQQMKHYSNSVAGGSGNVGGGDNSIISASGSNSSMGRQNNNDFPVKKGRISKSSQRPFRREPHNYDKAQPTLHQTTIYQQMLAEQQKNQQMQQHPQHLQQPTLASNTLQHQATVYQAAQQQQQQQQQQVQQQQTLNNTFTQSPQQYNTNLLNNPGTYGSSTENIANMVSGQLTGQNMNSNNAAGGFGLMTPPQVPNQMNASNQLNNNTLQNIKIEVPSPDVLTMFNLSQGSSEGYAPYKPYSHTGNFKKSASTGTYINMRGNTSNNQTMYMQQTQHDQTSSAGGGGTMHTQSLPLTLGIHLPGLANALQTRPAQLSPPNMQQTSQQRIITQQLNLPPQSTQQQNTQQQHHQHHHQQQHSSNQAQHLQTLLNSQHQQQQQHPQPQHQISQPTISTNLVPKEIFRSNSLPLNVSLQKLDPRLTQNDNNFAVPTKYHVGKSSKTRSRSNSIHQHMIHSPASSSSSSSSSSSTSANAMLVNSGTGGGIGGGVVGTNTLNLNHQLQSATSDPMLNSTLAQLLTTNTRMSSTLGKQQSVSTSNIATTPNVSMSTMTALQMQSTQLNVQNKVSTIAGPTSNMFTTTAQQYHQQQQQQQQSLSSPSSPTLINATSPISMQQQQHQQKQQLNQSQQQHQQHQQQKLIQTHHLQQQPHKSPKKSTSLPTPVAPSMLSSPPASKMLSYPLTASSQTGCSTHLSLSPESFHDQDSPLSPTQSLKYPRDSQRRAGHIHAEQKRRYNIKNGFDQLHDLIPQLQQNNAKLSKAAMLQKGAEHIKHLRNERNILKERMDALRMERDALNNSLTHLHSILPANGAPVTRQGTEHVRQLYEQYVRCRTQDNWKFWILGLILEPLLTSYTSTVSSASLDELRRTAFLWVDQHCSLIDLRPAVSNKLKYLSMKTDILSDPPSTLQEEIAKAVNNTSGQHPNLHGT